MLTPLEEYDCWRQDLDSCKDSMFEICRMVSCGLKDKKECFKELQELIYYSCKLLIEMEESSVPPEKYGEYTAIISEIPDYYHRVIGFMLRFIQK